MDGESRPDAAGKGPSIDRDPTCLLRPIPSLHLYCAIHRQQGEVGVRRILGILSLARKFGPDAVDDACAVALEMGVHEYQFVRRYLERCPQPPDLATG